MKASRGTVWFFLFHGVEIDRKRKRFPESLSLSAKALKA
jgi:hypothetical protein